MIVLKDFVLTLDKSKEEQENVMVVNQNTKNREIHKKINLVII